LIITRRLPLNGFNDAHKRSMEGITCVCLIQRNAMLLERMRDTVGEPTSQFVPAPSSLLPI